MKNVLLLGSRSHSRQELLKNARIPFKMVGHQADETACDWNAPFDQLLQTIARAKMKHIVLPPAQEGHICYALTADTMCKDSKGVVHGKPVDKEDAKLKIKALQGRGVCGTAFCLDKKVWREGKYQRTERIIKYVESSCEFEMPDIWAEKYLEAVPHYTQISGALTIEGFGAQFFKRIDGSYTAILGLPLFEVCQALKKLDFFD